MQLPEVGFAWMLAACWNDVTDVGPTRDQHRATSNSCLLEFGAGLSLDSVELTLTVPDMTPQTFMGFWDRKLPL